MHKVAVQKRTLNRMATKCVLLLSGPMLSCLAGGAWAAQPLTQQEQQQWLLLQMRVGEALSRDDLTRDSLARLQLIEPDHPQVLVGEIRQALAQKNQAWAEQLLIRLRQQSADSPALRQAQALINLQSADGQHQVQQARLLAAAGRFEEAAKAYEQLFGSEPPDLASALEYWSARSHIAGQRGVVLEQLRNLDRQYPGNAALRQTLVGLLFAENRPAEALAVLHQLAADPNASNNAAEREYNYLIKLPVGPDSVRAWQAFAGYYPYSPLNKDANKQLRDQQQLLGDPVWQAGVKAKALLDKGNAGDSATAESLLRRALQRYPQDPGLYGALGTALMRQSKYRQAYDAFSIAVSKEQDTDFISKWQDLQAAARNWMFLQKGDQALQRKDYPAARQAYQQSRRLKPADADSLVGLANVTLAESDDIAAEALLLQARKVEPGNGSVVRALMRLYQAQSMDKAEAFLNSLSASSQAQFASLRQSIELDRLNLQADAATQHGDWSKLVELLEKIRVLDPDNPWLTYRLANAQLTLGHGAQADDNFRQLLLRQGQNPEARYAHGLYLASANRDSDVIQTLKKIPATAWTDNMRELAARVQRRELLARADKLRDSGREPEAIALLSRKPTNDDLSTLADWAAQRGDQAQAQALYGKVLQNQPDTAEAQLGMIEALIASNQSGQAHRLLENITPPAAPSASWQRRLANAWLGVGERGKVGALFATLLQTPQSDPLIYRDAARLMARDQPQQALDNYAHSMAAAGLITAAQGSPRDNIALTEASRAKDNDTWMPRSLRNDVDQLYRQQNPTVTLYRDFAWRTDNTAPGLSDLTTQTTILRIDAPCSRAGFRPGRTGRFASQPLRHRRRWPAP